MILTSKGRYAVMALVDLALCQQGKPVSLALISQRQGIDLGYLEQLFSKLRKAEIVSSIKGPGGGYVLGKDSAVITVGEVLRAVEEDMKATRCEGKSTKGCMHDKSRCKTHHIWEGLESTINNFLDGITLLDICNKNKIEKEAA